MKQAIIINQENRKNLKNALDAVQENCYERLAHDFDIYRAVDHLENQLKYIPCEEWEGIIANIDPNSGHKTHWKLDGNPATQFTIARKDGNWELINVERGEARMAADQYIIAEMPDDLKYMLADFDIQLIQY